MSKEDFLLIANDLLKSFDDSVELPFSEGQNFFIVGAPRSGTTILSQSICSCLDISYVDNLMASFWKSPTFGALLSNKLINERFVSSFSEHGATKLVSDPHEFGAFWRDCLNYNDMTQQVDIEINWSRLLFKLDRICAVFKKPMLYKVFQLYWHLAEFHAYRPNTKWIFIEREVCSNVNSILKLRKSMTGSTDKWVSAKPKFSEQFDNQNNEVQVASQVLGINQWIRSEFSKLTCESWLTVSYEEFVKKPEATLETISNFLKVNIDKKKAKKFSSGVTVTSDFTPQKKVENAVDFVKQYVRK
jgi:Sulfotransferase family